MAASETTDSTQLRTGHYGNLITEQAAALRRFWLAFYSDIATRGDELIRNATRDAHPTLATDSTDALINGGGDDARSEDARSAVHDVSVAGDSHSATSSGATPNSSSSPKRSAKQGRFRNLVKGIGRSAKRDSEDDDAEADHGSGDDGGTSIAALSKDVDGLHVGDGETAISFDKIKSCALLDEMNVGLAHEIADRFALRFLRARKWDIDLSLDMMVETLLWRYEFDVQKVIRVGEADLNEEEIKSGKTYFTGKDFEGRPLIFVHAALHRKDPDFIIHSQKYAIWLLETGRLLLDGTMEDVTIVMDLTDFSMANMDYQGVKFLIGSMQKYYPESLGKAFIVNAPWIFSGCWAIIKHWLDPVVASKIQFVKTHELPTHMPAEHIPKKLGGEREDWEYDCPDEKPPAIPGGEEKFAAFKAKCDKFHEANLKWCSFNADDNEESTAELEKLYDERDKAMWEVSEAFPEIVKHVRSKTVFHRQNIVKEKGMD